MGKSNIEWTDMVWNPVTGCSKVSDGCKFCYAERMAMRFTGHFNVTCHPDRLDQPLHWKKPRRIFVCSMGDLFHEDVPDLFISEVFDIMGQQATQHQYIVLTKRSDRMKDWTNRAFGENDPYPNIIGMVTTENQEQADKRIPDLLQSRFAIRGVSIEPMLGGISLFDFLWEQNPNFQPPRFLDEDESYTVPHRIRCDESLDWVIVGAESGAGRRECKNEDVRNVVQQCRAANVPVFVKQLHFQKFPGKGLRLSKKMNEWPKDLQMQEYPG